MTLAWRVKHWDGSAWVNSDVRRWDGAEWAAANSYYWDGSQWALQTDRTPPTSTHTTDYAQVWRGTYGSDNNRRTDSNGASHNYQGDSGSSSYGNQRSMWSLGLGPFSDLQGAVAFYDSLVYVTNQWTYYNSGGTAVFGTNPINSGGAPSTFSERDSNVIQVHFERYQAKWIGLGTSLMGLFQAGLIFGFTLHASSNDVTFYGYYATTITYRQVYEK